MTEKKTSDFRYNTGESVVPWAAVGENYDVDDIMDVVRFMIKGEGPDYDATIKKTRDEIQKLHKLGQPPGKLSLGDKVVDLVKVPREE